MYRSNPHILDTFTPNKWDRVLHNKMMCVISSVHIKTSHPNIKLIPAPFILPSILLPDEANSPWMSKGDNPCQLVVATLEGVQSVSNLWILLYGGTVQKKWAINSVFMVLYPFAGVLVCWVCWDYHLSFRDTLIPIWVTVDVMLE